MGINFSQVLLSSIAFGVGYCIKARFEINQEKQIKELHTSIEVIEKRREEESETLQYQLWQVEQERDRLTGELWELMEKVKAGAFASIAQEKVDKSSKKNVLKNFV